MQSKQKTIYYKIKRQKKTWQEGQRKRLRERIGKSKNEREIKKGDEGKPANLTAAR
mgnify:CR=1 FL=1